MSKEDDDEMAETAHLLRNQANTERLAQAVERARHGEFEERDLIDVKYQSSAVERIINRRFDPDQIDAPTITPDDNIRGSNHT
jgi:hypothetical protein